MTNMIQDSLPKKMTKTIRNCFRDRVFWIWRYVLLEADIKDLCIIMPDIVVEYRFGDFSDIERLDMAHHEYDAEARKFALERLQSGDKVILGIHKGNIISYLWLMRGTMDIHYRNYIPISFNRIYAYKGFTTRDYRDKHVLAGAYRLVYDFMKQKGFDKVIASIDSRNHPSIKSTIKVGYRSVGTIFKIRFLSNIRCVMNGKLRSKIQNIR